MRNDRDTVLTVWCRLTGQDEDALPAVERGAFLARSEVLELSGIAYPDLLEAAITAARQGALPLDYWVDCARLERTSSNAQPNSCVQLSSDAKPTAVAASSICLVKSAI
jgi:hypothetical protein